MNLNKFPPGFTEHLFSPPGSPVPRGHPASRPSSFVCLGYLPAEFWKCEEASLLKLYLLLGEKKQNFFENRSGAVLNSSRTSMGTISLDFYTQELRVLYVTWVCQRELVQSKANAPKSKRLHLSLPDFLEAPKGSCSSEQPGLIKQAFVLK